MAAKIDTTPKEPPKEETPPEIKLTWRERTEKALEGVGISAKKLGVAIFIVVAVYATWRFLRWILGTTRAFLFYTFLVLGAPILATAIFHAITGTAVNYVVAELVIKRAAYIYSVSLISMAVLKFIYLKAKILGVLSFIAVVLLTLYIYALNVGFKMGELGLPCIVTNGENPILEIIGFILMPLGIVFIFILLLIAFGVGGNEE
jgi:hypothetical protein